MFQRKALQKLKEWHKAKKRKPLILRGARQVGKSTLVKLFARANSLNLVEINFETVTLPSLDSKIIDVDKIVRDIELVIGKKIDPSSDLIFFDEIQKNPNALLSLRYFYEKKPELGILAAGSLLDFLLQDTDISFPVGRVEFLQIGPVCFSEFLAATKQEVVLEEYQKDLSLISVKAHQILMEQYRIFCCIGGLPEAIQVYIDTKDLFAVRKVHRSIIQTYKADFLKYARKHEIFRCDKVFDFVPTHLGQKVKYAEIDASEKARDLGKATQTLLYARVLTAAYHTNATRIPLRAFIDERIFKLFFLDVGLALTQVEEDFANILHGDSVLSGPIAEQFVSQHLAYLNPELDTELFYWLRDKSSAKADIDFIFTMGNKIIPIEVKANENIRLKSLNVFMAENQKLANAVLVSGQHYESKMVKAKVLFQNDAIEVKYHLANIPLWAIEKINELKSELILDNIS